MLIFTHLLFDRRRLFFVQFVDVFLIWRFLYCIVVASIVFVHRDDDKNQINGSEREKKEKKKSFDRWRKVNVLNYYFICSYYNDECER